MTENVVRHKYIGPEDLLMYVLEAVEINEKYPDNSLYRCRYFSNGEFKEGLFYAFEIEIA